MLLQWLLPADSRGQLPTQRSAAGQHHILASRPHSGGQCDPAQHCGAPTCLLHKQPIGGWAPLH